MPTLTFMVFSGISRTATLSDLLAAKPLVDRSPFSESNSGPTIVNAPLSSSKEKEYQVKLQHLTELLNESEANHQRLLDQEKVNDKKKSVVYSPFASAYRL